MWWKEKKDPKKCQQSSGTWITSPQALPAPRLLWLWHPCFEQAYHSSTQLGNFQEHRGNRRAQRSSVLQAEQRCCYLSPWRHRCASRYFTSEGWRRRRRDASIGVRTRISVRIRRSGLEEGAAGGFFPRACDTRTENIVKSRAAAITCHFWHPEVHPNRQKRCTS